MRLSLHPGVVLPKGVVDAIRTFVAAAVPGLEPKRVTVLDDRGFALEESGDRGADGQTLAASLQSALDTVFGVRAVRWCGFALRRMLGRANCMQVRREPLGRPRDRRDARGRALR